MRGESLLVRGGVGHRAPPPIRVGRRQRRTIRESTFLQASAQVRAPARRCVMSVRHTRQRRISSGSISIVGVVLDGLGARGADRPGLTALSRVLGDDVSAAPASSPTARGALKQLQRKSYRAGIGGGSRRWFRTGHGREQHHGPANHDTVTVRCDRMNRIFWVVRSMTKKIIELSRGVVAAPPPMEQLRSAIARVSESC